MRMATPSTTASSGWPWGRTARTSAFGPARAGNDEELRAAPPRSGEAGRGGAAEAVPPLVRHLLRISRPLATSAPAVDLPEGSDGVDARSAFHRPRRGDRFSPCRRLARRG